LSDENALVTGRYDIINYKEALMRYSVVCGALALLCALSYAQEQDSTQVFKGPPPEVRIDISPPGQTAVDNDWFQQHNQALLDVLDVLVDDTYAGKEAKALKEKFSKEKESFTATADARMSAIRKLVDLKFTKK
jgi:hypothetical protein